MSFNPNPSYGYSVGQNYYVDDSEEFLPEYADSEAISDHHQILQNTQPPNVTEIYSRNDLGMVPQRQVVSNQLGYQNQGQYVQQYYYENPPIPQATRVMATAPYQEYTQAYDPRVHQYCPLTTSSLHDTTYDSAAYRSAHHNGNMTVLQPNHPMAYQEATQPAPVQKQHTVKRYPIKVGTPKYYRKPPSNAVYKRPSALCLSVASQPDPAVRRKHKKPATENQCGYAQNLTLSNDTTDTQLLGKPSEAMVTEHKVGSEGDFNLKMTKLETMFERFEKSGEVPKKSKGEIVKFAKFLKPRVPSSIKARQERTRFRPTQTDEDTTGVEEKDAKTDEQEENVVAGDSIERLLNQLKKCELAVCSDDIDKHFQRNNIQNSETQNNHKHKKIPPNRTKSFNYQDITDQMTKSQSEVKTFETDVDMGKCSSVHDISRHFNLSMTASKSFLVKPSLDDHCALELHRSKSYIVNLIDRALSKELGTVPSHRKSKEYDDMSPRKAIDMMNRHTCGKSEKELSMEITSALTDSIISNATAPEVAEIDPLPPSASSSKGKVCCCNAEEPTYIKQLKQLRWGHLKHIQREVRRLEDLERFLDSCSLNPISEI